MFRQARRFPFFADLDAPRHRLGAFGFHFIVSDNVNRNIGGEQILQGFLPFGFTGEAV
jgi:hypothetical protein